MGRAHLEHIIDPVSIETFFSEYWERKFLHIERNKMGYYDDILSISDIDQFMGLQNIIPESMRLVDNGTDIPFVKWVNNDKLASGVSKPAVNPERVYHYFKNGATVIINAAEKMLPRLSKVLIALEQALQTNLQANIYITPANAQGFKLHYDTHDIFVIQLKGPKAWRIYDTSEDLPVSLKAFNKQPELVKELTMNAGDLLYLPRGVVHEAFTSDVATIHLNISFRNKYGFNLIEHLAQSAAENAAFFRKSPPLGQAKTSDIENYTKALNAALNSLVENAGAEKMLQLQKEQFIKKQTLDFSGRLLDIFSSENLNADTVICRRKNFSYIIKQKGNEGIICYGNYELIIPAIVDRASLLQEGNFKVKDINGLLTDNGKISLVRDYIEAGFFTIADT